MNITGIRPYEAMGYYNNRIESKDAPLNQEVLSQDDYLEEAEVERARANQTQTAYDYAKQYNPEASYEMKGADSDLKSLDVINEVPKAHRDDALRQYQTFVGGKLMQDQAVADMVSARMMEDFSF
ncbi:MAG: hypothetical protein K6A30_07315 [Lachnospiraceae bacterium]|nr:hypothetical protein [Lachnospiraceae bacterium]